MKLRGRLFTAADLAPILGWSTRRTQIWMRTSGCGFKLGGRWYTTREKLIRMSEDVWMELADAFEHGDAE